MGTWQVERLALQSVYADLARCIDVSELLPVLFQNGVISGLDAKERIERHGETTMDKAVCLLDKLLKSDNPNALCLFIDALEDHNPHLAAQLKRNLNRIQASQPTMRYRSLARQEAVEARNKDRGVSGIFEEQCGWNISTRGGGIGGGFGINEQIGGRIGGGSVETLNAPDVRQLCCCTYRNKASHGLPPINEQQTMHCRVNTSEAPTHSITRCRPEHYNGHNQTPLCGCALKQDTPSTRCNRTDNDMVTPRHPCEHSLPTYEQVVANTRRPCENTESACSLTNGDNISPDAKCLTLNDYLPNRSSGTADTHFGETKLKQCYNPCEDTENNDPASHNSDIPSTILWTTLNNSCESSCPCNDSIASKQPKNPTNKPGNLAENHVNTPGNDHATDTPPKKLGLQRSDAIFDEDNFEHSTVAKKKSHTLPANMEDLAALRISSSVADGSSSNESDNEDTGIDKSKPEVGFSKANNKSFPRAKRELKLQRKAAVRRKSKQQD